MILKNSLFFRDDIGGMVAILVATGQEKQNNN